MPNVVINVAHGRHQEAREGRTKIKLIKNNKAMHHQESNASLYLQKSKGGRGLMEVKSVYKLAKIKVAHYVSLTEDPRLNLVRMAEERNHVKNLPSINTTSLQLC